MHHKAWVELVTVGIVLLTLCTLVVGSEVIGNEECIISSKGGWLSTLLRRELENSRSTMSGISWDHMCLKLHIKIVLLIGHQVIRSYKFYKISVQTENGKEVKLNAMT